MSVCEARLDRLITPFVYHDKDLRVIFADVILFLPFVVLKGKIYCYRPVEDSFANPFIFTVFFRIIAMGVFAHVAVTYFTATILLVGAAALIKLTNAKNTEIYRLFIENQAAALQRQAAPPPAPQLQVAAPPRVQAAPAAVVIDCTICLEPINRGQDVRALECMHNFHTPCITRWAAEQPRCPSCRRESEIMRQIAPRPAPLPDPDPDFWRRRSVVQLPPPPPIRRFESEYSPLVHFGHARERPPHIVRLLMIHRALENRLRLNH